MDAVIANTCSVIAVAMVTVWALVSAETYKDEQEGTHIADEDPTPFCSPNICSRVRCRGITMSECPQASSYIDPNGGWCGCCPKCVRRSGV